MTNSYTEYWFSQCVIEEKIFLRNVTKLSLLIKYSEKIESILVHKKNACQVS